MTDEQELNNFIDSNPHFLCNSSHNKQMVLKRAFTEAESHIRVFSDPELTRAVFNDAAIATHLIDFLAKPTSKLDVVVRNDVWQRRPDDPQILGIKNIKDQFPLQVSLRVAAQRDGLVSGIMTTDTDKVCIYRNSVSFKVSQSAKDFSRQFDVMKKRATETDNGYPPVALKLREYEF